MRKAVKRGASSEAAARSLSELSSASEIDELVALLSVVRNQDAQLQRGERIERKRALSRRRERPSRAALEAIMQDLRGALFPAHYGTSDFTEEGIDAFVRRALHRGLAALTEQVRRELAYHAARANEPQHDQAAAIVHSFARSLPGLRRMLDRDVQAAYQGDPAARSRAEVLFCYPGIAAIVHHRVAHELHRLGARLLARMIASIAHASTGIDIHPGAQIGESFFIDHGTGVVIGETTVIGEQVRIYQGVTLGARSVAREVDGDLSRGEPRHPILEGQVTIYAGATILGRVTIGHGSTIGGNVWLTHSVPPGTFVRQAQSTRDETAGPKDTTNPALGAGSR